MTDTCNGFGVALDSCLPQYQCKRCRYDDCNAYARAIQSNEADINRCEPGGMEIIAELSKRLNTPMPEPATDILAGPRMWSTIAHVDPLQCIGCTKCLPACPMDAIVGSAKRLHKVLDVYCTGCGLCLDPCPVDCITLKPSETAGEPDRVSTGNSATIPLSRQTRLQALLKQRYRDHKSRIKHNRQLRTRRLENADEQETSRRRSEILAAVSRVRRRRGV